MKFFSKLLKPSLCVALTGALVWAALPETCAESANIAELRQRQSQVQTVAKNALPAVVALTDRRASGAGSGVIVSPDGLIMTASHVLEALPDPFVVTLSDGTEVSAMKLGANRTHDAAMAQIIGEKTYAFMPVAESVEVGEWCIAMGHHGGPEADRTPPVRLGKVWKKGRRSGFLTTDCLLSGGDSGGPLFNLDGEVIGIHSSISYDHNHNRHAPVTAFHNDWDRMKSGEIWGELGTAAILEDDLSWTPRGNGALLGVQLNGNSPSVQSIVPGSAAENAQIQPLDEIVSFDGNLLDTTRELQRMVAEKKPGDEVTVEIVRDGESLALNVTLGGADEQFGNGLEQMERALEGDGANPPGNGQPRARKFRWNGNDADLSDLRREFERMGGLFGENLFDQLFSDRNQPRPEFLPPSFNMRGWFNLEAAEIPELSKNHPDELNKFIPVVAEARRNTVQILSGGNLLTLGTIVSENGYALTKRSELGPNAREFEARLADGRSVAARVVDHIGDDDLALLKLDAVGLAPVKFVQMELPVGSFVTAANITEAPAAAGVLSVLARNLSAKRKGFLGIGVESANGHVAVRSITPDSAAAAAGLRPADVITEIDGAEVLSAPQLIKAISGREPDTIIEISYLRNGRAVTTSARLRSRAELARMGYTLDRGAYDLTSRMGADLSRQRGGYPSALQHDLPLNSNQMGGPLVDLDGNVVGINIARAGRVSTYALPATEVNRILDSLNLDERSDASSADLNRKPEPPQAFHRQALREEVERAEHAIEAARNALRAAEESARAAREALNQQR